jgi:hypothetical protein
METDANQKVTRQAEFSGKFYPGSKEELLEELNNLCRDGKQPVDPLKFPLALVVPHAGYVFSGKVAASGYNQLISGYTPDRVFILASSHQSAFPGVSLFCSGNYQTPLGPVQVDVSTVKQLLSEDSLFNNREEFHQREHSLEVQLPFLQYKLGNQFRMVPMILGIRDPEDCRRLANSLRPWFHDNNLFVISSDFSHYPEYRDATASDRATTDAILSNSPEILLKTLEMNKKKKIPGLVTSLCGWTSVLTLLYLTENKNFSYQWIDYLNSGDHPFYGDHNRVVGYNAIAVYGEDRKGFYLTEEEKEILLKIADCALRNFICEGKGEIPEHLPQFGKLSEKYGAFVSIYIDGKLRGCIGRFENEDSLVKTVHIAAVSAASDRRFHPVSSGELDAMTIEISVLSPLRKIESPRDIIPGRHGIYMRKGWSSGTFLPQVAEKYGWTVEEMLERCAGDKAGIGREGWRTAELFVYEAIVFSHPHQ